MKYTKFLVFVCIQFFCLTSSVFAYTIQAPKSYRDAIQHYFNFSPKNKLVMLNVYGYQQTEDYTCAPSAVMELMHYYGMLSDKAMTRETEMKIANEMGSNNNTGTSPTQIVHWLETHGFKVEYHENGKIQAIYDAIDHGIPVIVEWIDWGGHWEAVMGYNQVGKKQDEDNDTFLFADPSAHFQSPPKPFVNGITSFNASRFDSMWFDAQYFNPGHLVSGIYIIAVPKGQDASK